MQIINVDQNSDEWFELRKGKITGSKVKDIVVKRGNKKKIGFYQLIADRLAVDPEEEDPRDRGHELEQEAADAFAKDANVTLHQDGMWISDLNSNIAISPDRVLISEDDKQTRYGAVEIKCPSSARHLQMIIENEVPSEYEEQVIEYFLVNEDLEFLYLVSYDPRVVSKPLHAIKVERSEVMGAVDNQKEYLTKTLVEVDEWVERLAF